jgi:predicted DNA-binding protein
MAEPRVQKTPRLPLKLAQKLEEEARNTGESENSIIVKALELYFKNKKESN